MGLFSSIQGTEIALNSSAAGLQQMLLTRSRLQQKKVIRLHRRKPSSTMRNIIILLFNYTLAVLMFRKDTGTSEVICTYM